MAATLDGRRVLIVSRHDIAHPRAGEIEHYLHQVALRWAAWGTSVTWLATGTRTMAASEVIDGVEVRRAGSASGACSRLARAGHWFDAVVDAFDGVGCLLPALTGRKTPVVRLTHRLPAPDGRRIALESRPRPEQPVVALSMTVAHELRRRHRLPSPIFVAPPGALSLPAQTGRRAADPTVAVLADQRADALLDALLAVAARIPALRLEIVGDHPELVTRARSAGLTPTVHSARSEDAVLRRAWVTVSTGETDLHGCAVLSAAARGVPTIGLTTPGIRDFVRPGRTGRLVDSAEDLAPALENALTWLADDDHARDTARQCQAWAGAFGWERSARLLAGVVASQVSADRAQRQRRQARSDMATVATFPAGDVADLGTRLRRTDEIGVADGVVTVLLRGCDESDASGVIERLGVPDAWLRVADHDDLLLGPHGLPAELTDQAHQQIPVARTPRG